MGKAADILTVFIKKSSSFYQFALAFAYAAASKRCKYTAAAPSVQQEEFYSDRDICISNIGI